MNFKIPGIKGFREPTEVEENEVDILSELNERRLFQNYLVNDNFSKNLLEYHLNKKRKSDNLIKGYQKFIKEIEG